MVASELKQEKQNCMQSPDDFVLQAILTVAETVYKV